MDDTDIFGTYEKHSKALQTEPTILTEEMSGSLRYWTDKLFSRCRFRRPKTVNYELSHNACFDRGRKDGGTHHSVMHKYYTGLVNEAPVQGSEYLNPRSEREINIRELEFTKLPAFLVEVLWDFYDAPDRLHFPIVEREVFLADGTASVEFGLPDLDYNRLVGLAEVYGDNRVMVAGICEPLKVRTITKGCAMTYSASMPVQRMMHGHLREIRCLSLIGRPNTVEDLYFVSNHPTTKWLARSGEVYFISGDYSGATDNLSINATKLIWTNIKKRCRIPSDVARVCDAVLLEQEIHYPPKSGVLPFKQTNGQLMGSTLSFPVLCVANLVCYAIALKRYWKEVTGEEKDFELSDLACLINGDDSLFAATLGLYELWKSATAELGFQLSPGKSLAHPWIATINSEQWSLVRGKWYLDPYFAVGLILRAGSGKISRVGDSKGLSVDGVETDTYDMGAIWNKIQKGVRKPREVLGHFLRLHKEKIDRITRHGALNLFIDRGLGGCGFELPDHFCPPEEMINPRYTWIQRVLAKRVMTRPTDRRFTFGWVPKDPCRNVMLWRKPTTSVLLRRSGGKNSEFHTIGDFSGEGFCFVEDLEVPDAQKVFVNSSVEQLCVGLSKEASKSGYKLCTVTDRDFKQIVRCRKAWQRDGTWWKDTSRLASVSDLRQFAYKRFSVLTNAEALGRGLRATLNHNATNEKVCHNPQKPIDKNDNQEERKESPEEG